jgi:hypothetical protein
MKHNLYNINIIFFETFVPFSFSELYSMLNIIYAECRYVKNSVVNMALGHGREQETMA